MELFTNKDLINARQSTAQETIDNLFLTIKTYLIENVGTLCGQKSFLRLDKTDDNRVNILLVHVDQHAKIICEITPPENHCWNVAMRKWVGNQVLQRFGAPADGGISEYFVL